MSTGPAETRGELTMSEQVVEKIAATALGEIGGSARRMLGVPLGSNDPGHRPRVTARVAGGLVGLDVTASVATPHRSPGSPTGPAPTSPPASAS